MLHLHPRNERRYSSLWSQVTDKLYHIMLYQVHLAWSPWYNWNNVVLNTITQPHPSFQFYWWRKPEDPEKTTDLSQLTDKLYHIMLYTSPWSRFVLTKSVVIDTDYLYKVTTVTEKDERNISFPFGLLKVQYIIEFEQQVPSWPWYRPNGKEIFLSSFSVTVVTLYR
jgi:hypothetical protein